MMRGLCGVLLLVVLAVPVLEAQGGCVVSFAGGETETRTQPMAEAPVLSQLVAGRYTVVALAGEWYQVQGAGWVRGELPQTPECRALLLPVSTPYQPISGTTVPQLTSLGDIFTTSGITPQLALAADGNLAIAALDMLHILEVGSWQQVAQQTLGGNFLERSADGRYSAVWGSEQGGVFMIQIVDAQGAIISRIPDGTTSAVAFSPDGRLLAQTHDAAFSADAATVELWDTTSGAVVGLLTHTQAAGALAFSPDGQLLAVAVGGGTVVLWDVFARTLTATLPTNLEGGGLAFSPDGRLLAVGGGEAVQIWEVLPRRLLYTLAAPLDGVVYALAFDPSGALLAASGGRLFTGATYPIYVFDTTQGGLLQTLPGHSGAVLDLAFVGEGRYLVSAGGAAVRVWGVQP